MKPSKAALAIVMLLGLSMLLLAACSNSGQLDETEPPAWTTVTRQPTSDGTPAASSRTTLTPGGEASIPSTSGQEAGTTPEAGSASGRATAPVPTTGPALIWEGRGVTGPGSTQCVRFELEESGEGQIGPCEGQTGETRPVSLQRTVEWEEIRERMASFIYSGEQGELTFRGQGDVAGEAWQRALFNWAQGVYQELETGRISAASQTRMAWMFEPVPGQAENCAQLIVLSYGYAYAQVVPCQGGQVQVVQGGWLETDEMEDFDGWMSTYARVNEDPNYFEGAGTQIPDLGEIQEISSWAKDVYNRLKPASAPDARP